MDLSAIVAEKRSVAQVLARCLGATAPVENAFIGGGFVVTWLSGHVAELSEPGDVDARWRRWTAEELPMLPRPIPWRVTDPVRFEAARRWLRDPSVTRVVGATDAGREGELIFRVLLELVGLDPVARELPIERLWLVSLTPEAVAEAFARLRPAAAFEGLYAAGLGRATIDWWVGMNLSRAMSLAAHAPRAAGRVQTPTLVEVARRDADRAAHVPKRLERLTARIGPVAAALVGPGTELALTGPVGHLSGWAGALQGAEVELFHRERRAERIWPAPLFDLDGLQQRAHAVLGLTAKATLDAAQRLYERELITYPRTASQTLPSSVASALRPGASADRLGLPLPPTPLDPRHVSDDSGHDHHAIVPTGAPLPDDLDPEARAVLELVDRRLLAVLAGPADTSLETMRFRVLQLGLPLTGAAPAGRLHPRHPDPELLAARREVMHPGWWGMEGAPPGAGEEEAPWPPLSVPSRARVTEVRIETWIQPPPPVHDDASLIGWMRTHGLGTPATRADTLEGLIARGYVERRGGLVCTELGRSLANAAPAALAEPAWTARLEAELSEVQRGSRPLSAVLDRAASDVARLVADVLAVAPDAPEPSGAVRIEPEQPMPPAGGSWARFLEVLGEGVDAAAVADAKRAMVQGQPVVLGVSSPWLLSRYALHLGSLVYTGAPAPFVDDEAQLLCGLGVRAARIDDPRRAEAELAEGRLDVALVPLDGLEERSAVPGVVDDLDHPRADAVVATAALACPKTGASLAARVDGTCAFEVAPASPKALAAALSAAGGPALVVVRTPADAEALARTHGGEAFHGHLPPAERAAHLERFARGRSAALFATEALPDRLAAPGLAAVIFAGRPSGLSALARRALGPAALDDTYRAVVIDDRVQPDSEPAAALLRWVADAVAAGADSEAAISQACRLERSVVARSLTALAAYGGVRAEADGRYRPADQGWPARHARRVGRREADGRALAWWLAAHGCRLCALDRALERVPGPPCGVCDRCDPQGAWVRRFRAPSPEERAAMTELIGQLQAGAMTRAAVRDALSPRGFGRAEVDRMLGGLAAAGVLEVDGQVRLGPEALTPDALSFVDLDA